MYPVRILENEDGGWISPIESNVSHADPGEWGWGMAFTYRK